MSLRAPRGPTPQVVVARVNPFPLVILLGALFFASSSSAQGYYHQDWWAGGMRQGVTLHFTPLRTVPTGPLYYPSGDYSSYFTRSPVFIMPVMDVGYFPTLNISPLVPLGVLP